MLEAGRGGAAGRGGLRAVGWRVAAVERSGKVSLEVKTAGELGAPRGEQGRGGPRDRAGSFGHGGKEACPAIPWGDRPTKDSWGARLRGRPRPRIRPPGSPGPGIRAPGRGGEFGAPASQPASVFQIRPGAAMSHGPKQPGAASV